MPRGTKKDPNKPKGRTTAYAFFVQSERERIRVENEENGKDDTPSFTQLSKSCSEKWKGLDDSKKAPFYKLAKNDKDRYEKEMANYTPSEDEDTPVKKSRKRKRNVDENQPKRNKSAYLFFCDEERPKIKESQPELSMTETSKVLGTMWSAASDKRKEKFTKMAEEDKERYAKEMKEYRQTSVEKDEEPGVKKQRELASHI